ncbi:MAG: SMP-30/gluconolactonase/LRE family protein [Verrucomicrobiales bacterium]|nr:SMP-30/gluconolactonase/LRE family protein [Verrucomicrobiales bacterium]
MICLILVAAFLAAGPLPAVPGALLVAPGDKQVSVSWQPSARAQTYNVKRGATANGPFVNVATNLASASWIDDGLTNGHTYHYAVTAVNDAGESTNAPSLSAQPSAPVLDWLPSGAKVERLATGFILGEGPVWIPAEGGYLIFSDFPTNRLYRWRLGGSTEIFRTNTGRANGNTLDLQGRLITCEHFTRRVSRTETNGTVVTLVSHYNHRTFNAPNDVAVKSDGTIWFTDPVQGNVHRQPGRYVYRFDPAVGNDSVVPVVTDFVQPNGICFSPDEKRLYISDSDAAHIRVFDVLANNTVTNGRVFQEITPGAPDGLRTDSAGRLWTSADDGAQIYDPNGTLLGKILTPEPAYNLCFGGTNQEMLFITAQTALYGITRRPDLAVTAIRRAPANPVAGQSVRFFAVVKNQGTGPTPNGVAIRVAFTVGTATNVVWSDGFSQSLSPDATVVLEANGGLAGPDWTARAGNQPLLATVDDLNRVPESNEMNNTLATTITSQPRAEGREVEN